MPKAKLGNVLVDDKKKLRAQEIAAILTREPRNDEEKNLKETFSRLITENEVKDEDVIEFVYTKLGGLVRTPDEDIAARKKAAEIKAKFDRKQAEKGDKKKKDDEDD